MKWILGYAVGAALLLTPLGLRLSLHSEAVPASLDLAGVAEGRMLFTHEWTANDPLCPTGDGLGPVFNAKSCAQCHTLGGIGGAGGNDHNVTLFANHLSRGKPVRGVIHADAIAEDFRETLTIVSSDLPPLKNPTLEEIRKAEEQVSQRLCRTLSFEISQRNTPALFGARHIDELPDSVILANERLQRLRWRDATGQRRDVPVGRALRLADGRIGKFGWKAQSADLLSFVQAACANELGLGNPGQAQAVSLTGKNYQAPGLDLTLEQCNQITAFVASLPRPIERTPADLQIKLGAARGRAYFSNVGCADCHVTNLGPLEGVYSDFLLHRMGSELKGGGSYFSPPPGSEPAPGTEPLADEWRTPPLWGIADSAPYMHDGRAATLEDAIRMHAGQAKDSALRFQNLGPERQQDLVLFLQSLRAPG